MLRRLAVLVLFSLAGSVAGVEPPGMGCITPIVRLAWRVPLLRR